MEIHTAVAGLLEVGAPVTPTPSDGSLVIDYAPVGQDIWLTMNGRRFSASSPAELAALLAEHRTQDAARLMSVPFSVDAAGSRVTIATDAEPTGACLTGAAAQSAADKAVAIAASSERSWPDSLDDLEDVVDLDLLIGDSRWDGPLVVSMPRTGSTLMGVLFLFCQDDSAPSGFRFERYLHEPVAPVFWRGDELERVGKFLVTPLADRDVVQESAYQFADPRVALWFLRQARQPIVFTMRHPQLSWPSRWRAMLAQLLDDDPEAPIAQAARAGITRNDFTGLGSYLSESVRPADNGFYAFVSLIDMCIRHGIEFMIVDNSRFRLRPESTLREMCRRLDVDFSPSMTEWSDLRDALPRVVMSDLALGDEYEWYYARTLGSDRGIQPELSSLVEPQCFPDELRGLSDHYLTIDEAVTWYHLLLARPETLP